MFWADTLGSKYIYSRLEEWSKLYGDFFKPCAYLADRAAKGASLVRILPEFIMSFYPYCFIIVEKGCNFLLSSQIVAKCFLYIFIYIYIYI